ncbi:MAG: AsmA family protein [Cyclobacteriaceae bacterium]|nr:AsmA family protein [Cyclobacteriaceae bacterium]MCH8515180.1 AsmA family protein [Cyclobacteriaceae bacterium]
MMKRFLKILKYILLSLLLLLSVAVGWVYFNQDRIISAFIDRANEQLNTPITIASVDLNVWSSFPLVAIDLRNISIKESSGKQENDLARLDRLRLSFSLVDIYRANYRVRQLDLIGGQLNLLVTESGEVNYQVLKPQSTDPKESNTFELDLETISLSEVGFRYVNHEINQAYGVNFSRSKARLKLLSDRLDIGLEGKADLEYVELGKKRYAANKALALAVSMQYFPEKSEIIFAPSRLELRSSIFSLSGKVSWYEEIYTDLLISSENAGIEGLISLLPPEQYAQFSAYRSKGDSRFAASIKGTSNANKSPSLKVDFDIDQGTLYHPSLGSEIEDLVFNGSLKAADMGQLSSYELDLRDLKGRVKRDVFSGELQIKDFDKYKTKISLKTEQDLDYVLGLYPNERIESARGRVAINADLKGELEKNREGERFRMIESSGDLRLEAVDLHFKQLDIGLSGVSGLFLLRRNDLAVQNLNGRYGNSHFNFTGVFTNLINFLLYEDQKIRIEADLQSERIDWDELLAINTTGQENNDELKQSDRYQFDISPNWEMQLNCSVSEMQFQRFKATNFKGKLDLKDQKARIRQGNLSAFGGQLDFIFNVDDSKRDELKIFSDIQTRGVRLQDLFYVFSDFNQDFLTHKHIKGNLNASVKTQVVLDRQLQFLPHRLLCNADLNIKNGELNNFEAMQEIGKFIKSESLSAVKFGNLTNQVVIEDKEIRIPKMLVVSNVGSFDVEGTHSFAQEIDYRLRLPVKMFGRQIDKDEAFGAVEESEKEANIFVKVIGNTSDFKVSYDSKAASQQFTENLKKEKENVKEIFKNKGKKEKEVELSEDEYFDF